MSYIEDIKNRRNVVRNNIAKSFGIEFQKSEENDIEKAVYADNARNRKLGRVGQEYHRGKKKGSKKINGVWKNDSTLNLDIAEKLWTEKESSAYDKALESNDNKTQNKLLKIAFNRANEKGWKIVEDD